MLMAIFFLRTRAGLELQVSSAKLNVSSVDLEEKYIWRAASVHHAAGKLMLGVGGRHADSRSKTLGVYTKKTFSTSSSFSSVILCHEK